MSGSELYEIAIHITPLPAAQWRGLKARCAGEIGSLVELLQGRLSKSVMEVVTAHDGGLFPKPREITFSCSCPDWASLCKHVAAVLYGVGARLDADPDVLFTLRGVDRAQLVSAGSDLSITQSAAGSARVLVEGDLAALFGVEIETPAASPKRAEPAAKVAKPKPVAPAPVSTKAGAKAPAGRIVKRADIRPAGKPLPLRSKRPTRPGKTRKA